MAGAEAVDGSFVFCAENARISAAISPDPLKQRPRMQVEIAPDERTLAKKQRKCSFAQKSARASQLRAAMVV